MHKATGSQVAEYDENSHTFLPQDPFYRQNLLCLVTDFTTFFQHWQHFPTLLIEKIHYFT